MNAHRAAIVLAGSTALAIFSTPAMAQVDDAIVLNILRNCAQIDDPTARLACFDNNIRIAGAQARNTVPGQVRVDGGNSPVSGRSASGFGNEDVRAQQQRAPVASPALSASADEIEERVSAIRMIAPGKYELGLASGAVWRFTDSTGNSYIAPRVGDDVEIRRASLGSFLLRYRNQESVRVERIR